ncbi:MAG: response regulator transcription factor [Anaerolineae bacterium]
MEFIFYCYFTDDMGGKMFTTTSLTQRLLVVEDDPATLRLVADKLTHAGYDVFGASSAEHGLDIISRRGVPHLAVVDIKLGGMDGFEFCRSVHQWSDLPIILLSAISEEDVIIQGIDLFAEDYVVKPFSPRELVARVQRVLRRIADTGYMLDRMLQIDEHLTLDLAHQQAIVDGRLVILRATETKLLYLLLRNAGHTVTTGFLLQRLWPFGDVFEDALRVYVHRLRQKIEPIPSQPQYILTERGVGYTFAVRRERVA